MLKIGSNSWILAKAVVGKIFYHALKGVAILKYGENRLLWHILGHDSD